MRPSKTAAYFLGDLGNFIKALETAILFATGVWNPVPSDSPTSAEMTLSGLLACCFLSLRFLFIQAFSCGLN